MPAKQWQTVAAKLGSDSGYRARTLSLLRGILRECTYLPDAAARQYMKKYVLERYRAYQPDVSASGPQVVSGKDRITAVTRKARKAFAFLRKANDGHLPHLTKVLFMTYGRVGRRRHELLSPLLRETYSSKITDTPMVKLPYIHAKLIARFGTLKPETMNAIPSISPALEALLKSQVDSRLQGPPLSTPKTLGIDLPELSAWYRRTPEKRIKNKAKSWFSDILARALPPLSHHEWHRLRKLAHGVTNWEGSVQRRPLQAAVEEGRFETSAMLSKHLGITGTGSTYTAPLLVHKPPSRFVKFTRPHDINSRFMQRLYKKVFQISPLMSKNDTTQAYQVKWGRADPEATSGLVKTRRQQNLSMLAMLEAAQEGEHLDNTDGKT